MRTSPTLLCIHRRQRTDQRLRQGVGQVSELDKDQMARD